MKKVFFLIIGIAFANFFQAQDIYGKWNGVLEVMGQQMPLSFNLSDSDQGLEATMDSPMEKAYDIPLTSASFENKVLTLIHSKINMRYTGTLTEDEIIIGEFVQNGMTFEMNLSREEVEIVAKRRPQEHDIPHPHYSEELEIKNENHMLSGTLTLPSEEGKYPVVILVSGSGPQDRNEELLGHKPFLILSDYLTRNGIGVFRYDDRGTYKSTGEFAGSTTQDFASDTDAIVEFLRKKKNINKKKIGIIGHSEGGLIAPMVAGTNKHVDLIVLLAGPGIPVGDLLIQQQTDILKLSGETQENIAITKDFISMAYTQAKKDLPEDQMRAEMQTIFEDWINEQPAFEIPGGMTKQEFIDSQIDQLLEPWFNNLISIDPAIALSKVKCPVLAINGAKDMQVSSKENLKAIENILLKFRNYDVSTIEFGNLNHLFQNCETGSPDEYGAIEETFAPEAMKAVLDWLQEQGY